MLLLSIYVLYSNVTDMYPVSCLEEIKLLQIVSILFQGQDTALPWSRHCTAMVKALHCHGQGTALPRSRHCTAKVKALHFHGQGTALPRYEIFIWKNVRKYWCWAPLWLRFFFWHACNCGFSSVTVFGFGYFAMKFPFFCGYNHYNQKCYCISMCSWYVKLL